ncbi:MAG: RHS repeat protein [Candidatus Azobacteroides sp.]|nr:RHS repeat protein [Candidatus Azobacteroides sp.]
METKIKLTNRILTMACLFFYSSGLSLFSQTTDFLNVPTVIPPSPQAAAFTIYGDYPVSYSTGVPDINIPLETIKMGTLEIPLTLKYHIGNVKPGTDISNVGFGWTLDAGGIITRTINNKPDETSARPSELKSGNTINQNNNDDYMYLYKFYDYVYNIDAEYDIFSFGFLNNYGGFIIDKQPSGSFKVYDYPRKPYIYTVITNNNLIETIKITDDNGNIFEFGNGEYESATTFYAYDNSNLFGSRTGWYLKKITTPENRTMTFTYSDPFLVDDLSKKVSYIEIVDNCTTNIINPGINGIPIPCATTGNYTGYGFALWPCPVAYYRESGWVSGNGYYFTRYNAKILKQIDFPDGKVVFTSEINSANNNRYITKLSIYNKSSALIKEIKFNQAKTGNYLQLNSMDFLEPGQGSSVEKYGFTYNSLLCGNTGAVDFWGYYNGVDAGKLVAQRTFNFANVNNPGMVSFGDPNAYKVSTYYQQAQTLQQIVYPTKGKTTFVWESNKYKGDQSVDGCTSCQGNGMRIQKIMNDPAVGNSTVKEYEYVDGYLANSPYDMQNVRTPGATAQFDVAMSGDGPNAYMYKTYLKSRVRTLQNQVPAGLSENIHYETVTEYFGEKSNHEGAKVYHYTYENPNEYAVTSGAITVGGGPESNFKYVRTKCGWGNGLLSEVEWLNKSLQIQKREKCYYEFYKDPVFNNFKVLPYTTYSSITSGYTGRIIQFTFNDRKDIMDNFPNVIFSEVFNYYFYYLYTGGYNIKKKEISDYREGQEVKTVTDYYYDNGKNKYPNRVETDLGYKKIIAENKYPYDYTVSPYTTMLSLNIIAPTIENTIKTVTNNVTALCSTTHTDYKQWNTNIFQPEYIRSSVGNNPLESRIQFYNRDSYGNPLYISKDNADKAVYLWGYNYQYPIAEIKGVAYSDVTGKIAESSLNTIAAKNELTTADSITINNLRTQLPNALVTTYTYKPLVGIQSMTDPRGVVTKYDYDSFGRLIKVTQADRVIESYEYHYKN